jgi:hypothetical protein
MYVIFMKIKLIGNLLIGKIQAHHVQANDPRTKRLVMPFKNRIGEIVELFLAGLAFISLPSVLRTMKPALGNIFRITSRATQSIRPTEIANTLETLFVIEQGVNPDHHSCIRAEGLSYLLGTPIEPRNIWSRCAPIKLYAMQSLRR